MDNFKKPKQGAKVNVRVNKKDQALINLYRESEYTKESSEIEQEIAEKEAEDDIESFIEGHNNPEQTDIPEKDAAKKARKKTAKKEQRKKSAKKVFLKLFALLFFVAVITIVVLTLFTPESSNNVIDSTKEESAKADEIYYSPLTGVESKNKDIATAAVTCIMIENSTDARPQSGLRDAGVVYEALAEGGISRFMAVYQENEPEYLGPIRSARLTFVHFAKQYQCAYVHVGGATNAIDELKAAGYRDINAGFYEEKYVSRKISKGRYAPHNVYSRFSWLNKLSYEKGWTSSSFTPFARIQADTINEVETLDALNINIKLSGDPSYNPSFAYDAASNTYLRSHQRGGAHMDRAEDGSLTQISPTVVIAMKVRTVARPGTPYSDYVSTGENECFVFQDGTVIAGKWKRNSVDDPLKFYDANGEEILLNRGQTWITAYPDNNGSVTW